MDDPQWSRVWGVNDLTLRGIWQPKQETTWKRGHIKDLPSMFIDQYDPKGEDSRGWEGTRPEVGQA